MTKRVLNRLQFQHLFDSGRMYLIRGVKEGRIEISRIRRKRGYFIVNNYVFQRKVGWPEEGAKTLPGDLAFKGYGKKWRLVKRILG